MASKEGSRIFVGGLSRETSERALEKAFSRFGTIIETQVMLEKHTGQSRGFGFITFTDRRAMEEAIREMHEQELDGRTISVNKAEPKMHSDETGYGGRESRASFRGPPVGNSDCFKCGRPGHWARECTYGGDDRPGRLSSGSRFSGGRGDRGSGDRYGDRYIDDRYEGGRYGDRDYYDSRDSRYVSGRDRYVDRYPPGDRFQSENFGGAIDRYPQNAYGGDRNYERDGPRGVAVYDRDGPRGGGGYDRDRAHGGGGIYERDGPRGGGGGARYGGGGPARYEGSYRERPGPYDRPARGGRPPSYDRF